MIHIYNVKYLILCLALCLSVIATPINIAQAQTPKFFSMMPDIPIKPGLEEIEEQALSFDKPQGRIIESIAEVQNGREDDILSYYQSSLPQLGWRQKNATTFTRDSERLILNFESYESKNFLRLTIQPR